jgi:hypothetical protein
MKKLLFIIFIAQTLLLSSCNDWLDILPNNEQVTADYWKAKEEVEAVLASGYYYLRQTTPFIIDWGELRGASIFALNSPEKGKLQDFQLIASSSLCSWKVFYQVINMANSVITYAPDVENIDETYTAAAMRSHQTEAYFLRALSYFYLVRNFKEVPLILESYVDDSAPFSMAKSKEEEIIQQIKVDIITALELNAAKEFFDNSNWGGASKGRATKWALYALMADVCLWSEDYDGCITYADYLINSTSPRRPAFMSIPEQWFTIFNPGNSNESIFELNWDYATYNQTAYSPSNYFTIAENAPYQYSPAMAERLVNETFTLINNGKTQVRSRWGAYIVPSGSDDDLENQTYCIWKYRGTEIEDISATRIYADGNLIIYRMADILLMKAEALIWKGRSTWPEALGLINQIRNRAYLDNLDISLDEADELEMLLIVLNERDIELAAEGKRWYDLLRFGKSNNYRYKADFIDLIGENNSSANSSWIRSVLKNEYAWFLPISDSELETNNLLIQNPYYDVTKK